MTISAIPVDQRVIAIDSRRFASIEKGLVELITNSDDSYTRMEAAGRPGSGRIEVRYERHQRGAVVVVTDQAEGMSFQQATSILAYGAAQSPLARGEGQARGYFGRGLKQAVFGLGHGWIETVHDDRFSRIDLFRDVNGGYLYDDGGADRPASRAARERLGIPANGTRVTLVVENPNANISHLRTVVSAVAGNVYLREVLERREVEILGMRGDTVVERSGRVRYVEPPSSLLLGPDHPASFVHEGETYPFTLTLKRAHDVQLTLKGDERTNGLVVVSGMATLDCQFFDFENQVGTEYLFGTIRCPALIEMLGRGVAVISDEREGLNRKTPFVEAFARAVSGLVAPQVRAEQEKLKHLETATTSGRTAEMIENLLHHMSEVATRDLGIRPPPQAAPEGAGGGTGEIPALRFTTPFYYRERNHPFQVGLLVHPETLGPGAEITLEYRTGSSLRIEPARTAIPLAEVGGSDRIQWTVVGEFPGDRGEIHARAGVHWAWCEIVLAEEGVSHREHAGAVHPRTERPSRPRERRDYGVDLFAGYEFRNLDNDVERAVYSPSERKILINTGAPTVQLYVDGRGHFRDSARLLLAELFMDVIADELARRLVEKAGHPGDVDAYRAARLDLVRRYGSDIHRSFLTR